MCDIWLHIYFPLYPRASWIYFRYTMIFINVYTFWLQYTVFAEKVIVSIVFCIIYATKHQWAFYGHYHVNHINLRVVTSIWLPLISNVLHKRNAVFEIRGRVFNRCERFILYSPLETAAKLNSLRGISCQCCHWKYFYKVVS